MVLGSVVIITTRMMFQLSSHVSRVLKHHSRSLSNWKNTLDSGLSHANHTGYCNEDSYRGLGNVHYPGAWTLGYLQNLAYAAWTNDTRAMQSAWGEIYGSHALGRHLPVAVVPKRAQRISKRLVQLGWRNDWNTPNPYNEDRA
jgi:hypothetical protein